MMLGASQLPPKGPRTIDLGELRERFKVFELDWPEGDISGLQRLRNDFEHFHSSAQVTTIRQVIASCFPLVEGFCEILCQSPAQLLGANTWQTMLEEKQFFAAQRAACNATLAHLPWHGLLQKVGLSCPDCGSALLYQIDPANDDPASIDAKCKACDSHLDAGLFVQLAVDAIHGSDDFATVRDGGESSINDCPDCAQPTYVQYGDIDVCYFCGERAASECARCGFQMSVNDVSINSPKFCTYCDHMMSKAD